jgi:hypothetical protein
MREEKLTSGYFDPAIKYSHEKYFTIYLPHRTAFFSHMTARTRDPESRRMPVYAAVTLVLAMVAVLLAAGCVSHPLTENNLTQMTVPPSTISVDLERQNDWAYQYRDNLTPAQKKIPGDLLQIIDPNYPKEHRHFTKKDLAANFYFVPAENASQEFNISESQALADGGEILVHIDLQSSASLDVIDSLVTKIDGKSEKWHFISAWIGLNDLESVASRPEVIQIRLEYPATIFSG